ncbi:hypothetical protein SAMN02910263_03431 [Butyrivibrio sp. INlla16]|nr:hypothetical protein SAMN02910263_03431 [Butyrivibrio sp. INlla16]
MDDISLFIDIRIYRAIETDAACLYCDNQAVGWIYDSVMSLREVGLDYLPDDIKRPGKDNTIQELVIPLHYVKADWLPKAVQDTANIRRNNDK